MRYRKPRALNWVSFGMVIGAGLGVYLLYYLWPVYSASSRAKGILYDHVPALYKANLRGDEVASAMIEDIKTGILNDMQKAGINDKAAKVVLHRNPKEVSLEVHFKVKARFPVPDRTFEFTLSPKVVSDATRIDW
jgi:hypothetical protein